MKKNLLILIFNILFFFSPVNISCQIGEIKDLASGAGDLFSGCSPSDIDAGCSALSCCWDAGFYFLDFLIDHHQEILNMRNLDPTVLSFEVNPDLAYALHFGKDQVYQYVNYLPGARANIGIISADFRFNMLTEYTNDFPDSFKSWEMLFLLNIIPAESFKITFGTGAYYETFTESWFNEHYLEFKILMPNHHDFFDLDSRVAVDYERGLIPFMEAGITYNTRFISVNHVNAYLSFGAMYLNYYSAHDIWAAKGGVKLMFF
jgi:hypothetical protein